MFLEYKNSDNEENLKTNFAEFEKLNPFSSIESKKLHIEIEFCRLLLLLLLLLLLPFLAPSS